MRVLIAPDSFTGTLSAPQAAEAIAAGWRSEAPDDILDLAPLSDGGPGFAEAMAAATGGTLVTIEVTGPVGTPVPAHYAVSSDGGTAYLESAQACGLALIPFDQRDPRRSSTYGLGEMLRAAVRSGVREVIIGLGGTGTCDGGAGLLCALDARAASRGGQDVTHLLRTGGGGLVDIASLDLAAASTLCRQVQLTVATDVDVPLLGARGAAHGFAPQKGADAAAVEQLETAMAHWARLLPRVPVGSVAKEPAVLLGAGAGGGLAAALMALGARRVPGIATIMAAAGIADRIESADLVVTGEGCLDWQSIHGKVVDGVAREGLARMRPVVVVSGRVEIGRREWAGAGISAVYSCVDEAGDRDSPLRAPGHWLSRTAARAARSWSRS